MDQLKQQAIADAIKKEIPYGFAKNGNIEVRVTEAWNGRTCKTSWRATWFVNGIQTPKSKIAYK